MRPARPDAPLADDELEQLFAPLDGAGLVALAVSGGADSLALLTAADRWRRRRAGRPSLLVLTVDHRLRAESTAEAANVAAVAAQHGLAARVLAWEGPHPGKGIEAAARNARYRLLVAAAVEVGATHLLTAHQQEDQAETFLMRLERGAHALGLAAMRQAIVIDTGEPGRALTLFRPFLAIPRARLAATTAAAGLEPVEDPMNADQRYLRARSRSLLPRLAAAGMHAARLGRTAARMRLLAEAVEDAATALLASAVTVDRFAVARLDRSAFAAAPADVQLRALARVLLAIGGEDYPPRFASLAAARAAILNGRGGASRYKRTLAGVVVDATPGEVRFYRESGRHGLPRVDLAPGASGVWDGRFRFSVPAGAGAGLRLGAVGKPGRELARLRPSHLPAAAFSALPAVFQGNELVAVAGLDFPGDGPLFPVRLTAYLQERLAKPPLFPDFLIERG